jgi:excisionase family DNA binding protein
MKHTKKIPHWQEAYEDWRAWGGRPAMLTTADVARIFNVTPRTIYRWIKNGRLKGIRVGGRGGDYRFDVEELARFINRP